MDTRKRAELFSRYVGLELKGAISSRQMTAKNVAVTIHRSPAAFNRWLNGKVEIPVSVVCEACEVIDVEPAYIVETAYNRMVHELGERDEASARPALTDVGRLEDHPDVTINPEGVKRADKLAAKRGRRKADDTPWAE